MSASMSLTESEIRPSLALTAARRLALLYTPATPSEASMPPANTDFPMAVRPIAAMKREAIRSSIERNLALFFFDRSVQSFNYDVALRGGKVQCQTEMERYSFPTRIVALYYRTRDL